jgi:hypothetical protein
MLMNDCSATAAQILHKMNYERIKSEYKGQFGIDLIDRFITDSGLVSGNGTQTGELVRYADMNNVPKHAATVLYNDNDGNSFVFSRNGKDGVFSVEPLSQMQSYTTPKGTSTIKGIKDTDSGFYRPKGN